MQEEMDRYKEFEAEIIAMREVGKTRQEIAEYLGLEKGQIGTGVVPLTLRHSA